MLIEPDEIAYYAAWQRVIQKASSGQEKDAGKPLLKYDEASVMSFGMMR